MKISLGPKEEASFPKGWRRVAEVDGVKYRVGVQSRGRVRLMYRPRTQRGHIWSGWVYRLEDGARLWAGDVRGSIGARGLLRAAGVIQ